MKIDLSTTFTILASFYLSIATAADSKDLSDWSAKCKFGKTNVIFHAKSKSGDAFEDDMTARIQLKKKDLIVPIGTAFFSPIAPAKGFGICDKTVGLEVNKNQFLILFATNGRPSLDSLTALLIDTSSGDIIDLKKSLGGFFNPPNERHIEFEKIENGFRSLMAQGWNKTGKTDSAQEVLSGWIRVTVSNGNILARWEKPLPETHKPFSQQAEVLPALEK